MEDSKWKSLLLKCTHNYQQFEYHYYVNVIRAYAKHLDCKLEVRSISDISRNIIWASPAELMIYFVVYAFQKKKENKEEPSSQMRILSLLFLTYSMEAHGLSMNQGLKNFIILVIQNANLVMCKEGNLTKYVLQLFFVWVYCEEEVKITKELEKMKTRFKPFLDRMFSNKKLFGIR